MRVVSELLRAAALAAAAGFALGACSSSDKAGATGAKDSGTGGGGGGGATGIFKPDPDAGRMVHLGDAAIRACGGFGRGAAGCEACLQKNCCDAGTACARNGSCSLNAACIKTCDTKSGADGDSCRQACADKYFMAAGTEYNGLSLCMGNSCKTECPFSGP